MKHNILITGSSGFIGSSFIKYINNKHNIFECDRKIGFEVLDITKEYLLINSIDIVIHLAAQTSVWNDDHNLIVNDNIIPFIYVFNLCKELNIKFVYASSSCSINITSMYGLSKSFTDNYVSIYGYDNCIGLRFHNVYGANSRENTLLGICLSNKSIILWNNGINRRHFTYIDDVCKAITKAFVLQSGLYNVVNPEESTVFDFVKEVNKYKNINMILIPNVRDYDKEYQEIDESNDNLIKDEYTNIQIGLKKCFS